LLASIFKYEIELSTLNLLSMWGKKKKEALTSYPLANLYLVHQAVIYYKGSQNTTVID
jgi:hypothetical protein